MANTATHTEAERDLSLGEMITVARVRAGYRFRTEFAADLQEALGSSTHEKTVRRWELDQNTPPFDVMVAISDLTGWSLERFAESYPRSDSNRRSSDYEIVGQLVLFPGAAAAVDVVIDLTDEERGATVLPFSRAVAKRALVGASS